MTARSSIKINNVNRPSFKKPAGEEDHMKPKREIGPRNILSQGLDRKPVSKGDNHTKEKAEGEQIKISVLRRLKLDIGDLEAEIRLEWQKKCRWFSCYWERCFTGERGSI